MKKLEKGAVIRSVIGDTEQFKRDLLKKLENEVFETNHHLQDRLHELAKEMITDYIYFESVDFDKTQDKAEEIVNRHIEAFYTLAE